MADHPQIVKQLDILQRDCRILEFTHFAAAERTNRFNGWFGVPSVIISIVLGSTFFALLAKDLPDSAKWAGAIAALVSAVLGAIQTFFNFQKTSQTHRTVGNRYLGIARECERFLAMYCDGLVALPALAQKYAEVDEEYRKITVASESVLTTAGDYATGTRKQKAQEAAKPSPLGTAGPDDSSGKATAS